MKEKLTILVMLLEALVIASSATGNVIFVDNNATGADDGSSWTDAYNYLQDALADANSSCKPVEIRVAEGIYRPDSNSAEPNGSGDRAATFQLASGVAVKGGYGGYGESDPNARDIILYETILSGDLAGNDIDVNDPADLWDEPTRSENSYHVVTGSGTDETAVLKGLTITGGNANGSYWWDRCGGGMYNDTGHPMLHNCTFRFNGGGGMYNSNDSQSSITNCCFSGNSPYGMYNYSNSGPTIANCTFSGNSGNGVYNWLNSSPTLSDCIISSNGGPGMINGSSSNPILTNCTFNSNSGGGMLNNMSSNPTLTNCTFSGNWARTTCIAGGCSVGKGGGMSNGYSNPILINCTFSGNSADGIGGGMFNADSSPTLINCIFSGNLAGQAGGGMTNWWQSNPTLVNCIFSVNMADCGGGIYNGHNGNPTLTNCILWDNEALEGRQIALGAGYGGSGPSTITVSYCDVQGGAPGVFVDSGCTLNWCEGNIDADPYFVQPGYWEPPSPPPPPSQPLSISAASSMSDNQQYTWVDGDYHLLPDSPCIDAGDPNYVAEPNETDLDGRPRVLDGNGDAIAVVDMGAYESIPPIPAEVRITPRTINLASKSKWLTCYIWLPDNYSITDIDSNAIFIFGKIQAESVQVSEKQQVAIAEFSREEVQTILNTGEVELSIIGWLIDGTIFEGRDLIRVTSKSGGKPDKYVQASNPNPADGATGVDINADLSWTASPSAISHDVYFGTSNPPPFVCNQTAITFDPGTMDYETRYYWRIDEVSKWGVTDGQPWSFTTEEGGGKPPGAPPGCFPADTPVWIDGEQVQISKVAAGRKVGRIDATKAASCSEKPVCLKEIESVLEYQGTEDYYNIVLENGNRINVVHSHYFLTASDQWVRVENLKAGSKLRSLNGPIPIKTISKREVPFTGRFYNLKIKGGDRYFVGKDGVTVRGH